MSKRYSFTDLRSDFEKECCTVDRTRIQGFPQDYRKTDEYLEWLERNVMKYRQEALDITEMNVEIAAQVEQEHDGGCCGCGCNEQN